MSKVKKGEIVFLYDLSWANPNGDPNDANKPRIDSETGLNIVTDVRLKRTIRDELVENGYEILIRDTYDEATGKLNDGKARAKDFIDKGVNMSKLTPEQKQKLYDNVKKCIDVRLFGCVLPCDKNSVTFTGPVQFKFGTSMHKVKMNYMKGTGAFASTGEKSEQRSFRQEYVLSYSLINFYGMINPRAAEITGLTEEDVNIMLDAMWDGTKNLVTRTKAGQEPRLLIKVDYKDDSYIGAIDKLIKFESEKNGEAIRSIEEGTIILEKLKEELIKNKDRIESVYIRKDENIKTDINFGEELRNNGITTIEK